MEKDMTLEKAEIPENEKIDILITEGTYGTLTHRNRDERVKDLIE